MTTQNVQAKLLFNGGWATDFGPTSTVALQQDGTIQIPFLVNAENLVYDLDGGPRKIDGTERVNSTALASGSTIRGLTDFWILGTGASATQHRVLHVNNDVMKDDADGTFTSILASADRVTTSIPSYSVFDDDLMIMSDADEAPLRWTGSGNASTLGTNTPKFAFGITHKNRFWGAGAIANKSRLFYSEPLPNGANGNWDEVEAGFIDIDPDDGDEIRGLVSHKGEVWVFKGPYLGSIHRIAGDTPLGGVTAFGSSTQPIPFSREIFVRGLGAAGHNSIFRFRDDIGFIDAKTGSIRSLNATAAFGDFREASLSLPINDFLLERVNKGRLQRAWAVSDVSHGYVLITLAIDGSTTNNIVLCMDHRFETPRWSQWPAVVAESMTSVIDPTRSLRQTPFIGDTSGFMRRLGAANKSIDGITAINFKATLPYINYGNPVSFKTFSRGSVGIEPRGNYNGTFGWSRDNNAQQTTTFSQGGGDVLAGDVTTGTVTLTGGTSTFISFLTSTAHGLSVGDVISYRGDSGAITAIAQNSTDITVTAGTHSLLVGDLVTIGATTDYNGEFTVTAISAGVSFDVTATFTSDQTGTFAASNYNAKHTIVTIASTTIFHVPGAVIADTPGTWERSTTANFFVLGTSTLSGSRFVDRFFSLEEGGEFRSIQYEITQTGLNEDIALHSIFTEIEPGADSTEN